MKLPVSQQRMIAVFILILIGVGVMWRVTHKTMQKASDTISLVTETKSGKQPIISNDLAQALLDESKKEYALSIQESQKWNPDAKLIAVGVDIKNFDNPAIADSYSALNLSFSSSLADS